MKVFKFGGTSVKDADAMKQIFNIISVDASERIIVVLSACAGITDKLIELVNSAVYSSTNEIKANIKYIKDFHLSIVDNLFQNKVIKKEVSKHISLLINDLSSLIEGVSILKECTPKSVAHCTSTGELLSTTIFFNYCVEKNLDCNYIDSRQYIKTDSNYTQAGINFIETEQNIKKLSTAITDNVIIAQGFIASDSNNRTTTLGRGGSDYSAAIFGAYSDSDEIQIWTDVNGVLSADPKIIKEPKTIKEMCFEEIEELAFFGAKVLHPKTIKPAIDKKIPIKILNTFMPENIGTTISHFPTPFIGIKSITLKHNIYLLKIHDLKELGTIINILNETKEEILAASSINSKIYIILNNIKTNILNKLTSKFKNLDIDLYSLICISGNIKNENYIDKQILDKINKVGKEIPVKAILAGPSEHSILLLTDKHLKDEMLEKIHHIIFG